MDSLNLQGSTQSLNFRLRTVLPFANPGYDLLQDVTELEHWSSLRSPGVYRHPSTFWSITLQPHEGYQAAIY